MQPSHPGPLIIASRTDPASHNIAENLIQLHGFKQVATIARRPVYESRNVKLFFVDKECIHVDPSEVEVEASSIIFVSKHRSDTGTPALTAHATGNLTREAMFGGKPEEVSFVEPFRIHTALSTLFQGVEKANLQLEVTMEATHHGPTSFPVPVCFIEVGSGPEEWANPALGRIVADAAMASATTTPTRGANAVGFGGTHYSSKLTRMNLEGEYLIGHIVSRYAVEAEASDSIIRAVFRKTAGECRTAVVDWKGLKGEQRRELTGKLSSWNIQVVRC